MENKGWLANKLKDPEFQRLCAREDFIEDFLDYVQEEMQRVGMSRTELARRMGCKPANITQMFRRTRNLTASTMVDIAFHLNLRMRVVFSRWETSTKPLWQLDSIQKKPLILKEEGPANGPLLHIVSNQCVEGTHWQ